MLTNEKIHNECDKDDSQGTHGVSFLFPQEEDVRRRYALSLGSMLLCGTNE
jgi:hypothetical protein